jgi:HD superfamily phosphodiesterase
MLTDEKLNNLTIQYGGEYNLNHTKRILKIIEIIGKNYNYDLEVVKLSAYLHDWGAYEPGFIAGVDHAERSAELAEQFLKSENINIDILNKVIETIKNHHNANQDKCLEAKLFSDADGIDFIGIIGVFRNFTTRPKEMKKAFDASKKRMELVIKNVCLKDSQILMNKNTIKSI